MTAQIVFSTPISYYQGPAQAVFGNFRWTPEGLFNKIVGKVRSIKTHRLINKGFYPSDRKLGAVVGVERGVTFGSEGLSLTHTGCICGLGLQARFQRLYDAIYLLIDDCVKYFSRSLGRVLTTKQEDPPRLVVAPTRKRAGAFR